MNEESDATAESVLQQGIALHGQRQLAEARPRYEQALKLRPQEFRRRSTWKS